MKYLGIIIDDKFKFSQHISYAAENVLNLFTVYLNRLRYHGDSKMKR